MSDRLICRHTNSGNEDTDIHINGNIKKKGYRPSVYLAETDQNPCKVPLLSQMAVICGSCIQWMKMDQSVSISLYQALIDP